MQTEPFKRRLEEQRDRLERMIDTRRNSALMPGSAGLNDSFSNSGDDEYADAATDTVEREIDLTMVNKFRHRLENVKVALLRIDEGSYGTCIRCRQAIGEARLDAIPETRYCRDCESDVEVQG